MSSLSFAGDSTSYISIASSNDTKMGTGDFTIEWYQYQTDSNAFPRIFQIGNYPSTSIGTSIENGYFYFWTAGSFRGGVSLGSYKNSWVHFAIVRSSGTTSVYKNGTLLFTAFSDSTNYNSSLDLLIGNETNRSNSAAFGGYMAYFHIIKGEAKYTSNFTVSNTFPTASAGTVYLLKTSGNIGSNITVSNVGTNPSLPSGFVTDSPPPTTLVVVIPRVLTPAYTMNHLVFYKPGTVSSTTGSTSVSNNRAKARRT
jgi:hypothetical protein